MDFLPPTAPSLVFARETYTPYSVNNEIIVGQHMLMLHQSLHLLLQLSNRQTERQTETCNLNTSDSQTCSIVQPNNKVTISHPAYLIHHYILSSLHYLLWNHHNYTIYYLFYIICSGIITITLSVIYFTLFVTESSQLHYLLSSLHYLLWHHHNYTISYLVYIIVYTTVIPKLHQCV